MTIKGPWRRLRKFDERELDRISLDLRRAPTGDIPITPDMVHAAAAGSWSRRSARARCASRSTAVEKIVEVAAASRAARSTAIIVAEIKATPRRVKVRGGERCSRRCPPCGRARSSSRAAPRLRRPRSRPSSPPDGVELDRAARDRVHVTVDEELVTRKFPGAVTVALRSAAGERASSREVDGRARAGRGHADRRAAGGREGQELPRRRARQVHRRRKPREVDRRRSTACRRASASSISPERVKSRPRPRPAPPSTPPVARPTFAAHPRIVLPSGDEQRPHSVRHRRHARRREPRADDGRDRDAARHGDRRAAAPARPPHAHRDRQGHAPLGLHVRVRARVGHRVDGRRRLADRPAADARASRSSRRRCAATPAS